VFLADSSAGFDAFWLAYLRRHAKPGTRAAHYAGVAAAAAGTVGWVMSADILWLALGLAAFLALVALGHGLIEKNRIFLLNRPLWAFAACLRMAFDALVGRLDEDLRRAGL
jgi:hypothetical protein